MKRRLISVLGTAAMAGGTAAALGVSGAAATATAGAAIAPMPLARMVSTNGYAKPPTTADCEAALGIACYQPSQFQTAYDLAPLYNKGYNGKGETIVIVDSYGYQNIGDELTTFDNAFHLPAPPDFTVLQPNGPVPPFNPTARPEMAGWALETSLDVEYAHTIAPGANILLVETTVPETLGVQGFPQIDQAENYVINHHLGSVITQSFGAPEPTFPNAQSIMNLRNDYVNAANNGVTVLGAAGDAGATGGKTLTPQGFASTFFLHRVAEWPADDPLVTGVGGTQLHLNAEGQKTQPDTVWNDTNLFDSPAAGSGGLSQIFSRPSYQNSVSNIVGSARGFPDISMSAAVDGAALVYLDTPAAKAFGAPAAGYFLVGGTSEASPLFSGIIAIADQWAGHGLGLINPALYRMNSAGDAGIVDVTGGTNTVTFPQNGSNHTVLGWDARVGYDLASGVGTVDAASFIPELVAADR